MTAWLLVLAFFLGASVGSFANVVIYRLPLGRSVARPSSRCPCCDTPIKARHNVPILSWLVLRGRCAACQVPISPRYLLVELAMGVLAVALMADFMGGGATVKSFRDGHFLGEVLPPFVLMLTFVTVLVIDALIDFDWFILPDRLTLPLIPLGLLTALAAGPQIGVTVADAAIGAAAGAALILLVILGYGALTGRAGMGGGDWKLLAGIGAFLGWRLLPVVILAASLQGLVFAVVFRKGFAVAQLPPDPLDPGDQSAATDAPPDDGEVPFRRLAVPFGPFLALAAIEVLLFREELGRLLAAAVRG